MRRLDQDLSRFTIELEADTAGITELLEQSTLYTIISFCTTSTLQSARRGHFFHTFSYSHRK